MSDTDFIIDSGYSVQQDKAEALQIRLRAGLLSLGGKSSQAREGGTRDSVSLSIQAVAPDSIKPQSAPNDCWVTPVVTPDAPSR